MSALQDNGMRVLAIDDDPSMLVLVSRMLQIAGYRVDMASSGSDGLLRIRSETPDLVLCDVQMPGVDGFEVLDCVRTTLATATLPFVMLTSLSDRDSIRRGMRLGADDFLTKPVKAQELAEAVSLALERRRRITSLTGERPAAAQERAPAIPAVPETELAGMTGRTLTQTVLFADIRGFTSMSERLPVTEVAELLSRFLREACKPILHEGGRIMKIMGDGLMAVFGADAPEDTAAHAAAALRAGHRLVDVAQQFRSWIASRFDLVGLPPFDVGVGIHTGQVMLFHLSAGGSGDLTAVGDTVNVASRLEAKSKELGWPVVASMTTIEHAGKDDAVVEMRELELNGRDARIVVGRLLPDDADWSQPLELSTAVAAMLDETARSTAEAAKQALDQTLHSIGALLGHADAPEGQEPVINGYRIHDKIGEGGMSSVYLAEGQAGRVVLKVLKGRRGDDEGLWKRFFQECAILSSIDHENVVRIYDQGFGDERAYIAMEHLGGGGLRELIDRGLSPRQALSLLSQAASGLAAIHHQGILHRDIKPANIMLRENGVLVLTDFGAAKRLDQSATQTVHGEILGTPYYISPEQSAGDKVDERTDIYALGVIFHEMLTGRRPFSGETIFEILAQHVTAPVPRLPEALGDFQGLIDGMLAKKPADRFPNADAVLEEIDRVWTQQAMRNAANAGHAVGYAR